jgi:hypothetical protein
LQFKNLDNLCSSVSKKKIPILLNYYFGALESLWLNRYLFFCIT